MNHFLSPNSFAADKDHLARFEQEAQANSALNHPNISENDKFRRKSELTD
jgi:hypothetical protein